MRILILTGKFGMGHVAAAEAAADQLRRRYPGAEIRIVDLMESLYPKLYPYIYIGFNAMVDKTPRIYNAMICLNGQLARLPLKRKSANADIIRDLVEQFRPDAIVSTWLIGSKYIGAYKQQAGSDIPFITCITDILAFDEWLSPATDAYIVGSEDTRQALAAKGIDPAIVHVGGIPVRQGFGQRCLPARPKASEVLIMGGGLGFLPDAGQLLGFLATLPSVHVTVIAGRNRKLYAALKDRCPKVEVLGYTDRVAAYMAAADVLVTKPGGATTFEAIEAEVPLFVPAPYFEQEKANAAFIEKEGLGRVIWERGQSCGPALGELLLDQCARQRIKNNMRRFKESIRGGELPEVLDQLANRRQQDARLEG